VRLVEVDLLERDFTSGEIIKVTFDPSSHYLEMTWRNKTVVAHKPVPEEIFKRLCTAPNRAVYYEDRVAEEYPKAQVQKNLAADAKNKLDDLFR
jgi:hypothetical protein